MAPHSGAGGWAPRPRKPSPAAVRMIPAMSRPTRTISDEVQSGTTWPSTIRSGPAPWRRIAAMKSLRRIVSVSARATRAYGGQAVKAMAMTAFSMPGPSADDEGQREDEPREGEEDVGHPHQHRVHPAAQVAGGGPDEEADGRDHDHDEPHDHRA